MPIPVIDLFAGPGGLGEGFSSVVGKDRNRTFKIGLSIEMDEHAHRTLELRAFLREFPLGDAPQAYYDYLCRKLSREELFQLYAKQAKRAEQEAWHAELGGERFPDEQIDARIRKVLGNRKRWVLIGGPPCQAYSLVGRSRVIGGEGLEAYEADLRHHLYKHYLRIIAEHRPAVFVMENVKGLLSAKVKEERVFERILKDLQEPLAAVPSVKKNKRDNLNYRLVPLVPTSEGALEGLGHFQPEDFIIRSEKFGVPQARHRLIILGIRSDLGGKPAQLSPSKTTTVEEAVGDLPRLRSGLSKEEDSFEAWIAAIRQAPGATWFQNGSVPSDVRDAISGAIEKIESALGRGDDFVKGEARPRCHRGWFFDSRLSGVCNHETRGHIVTDLHRYLFASAFAKLRERSPNLEDFPKALLPAHKNVGEALEGSKFNDRFRVQLADKPSTTVVSHISKDGHYYIHYDPTQCRSLTVREAARLQTFPDNYFFEGNRTQQYHQVGNAVPPLLARQIAEIVADLLV